MAPTSLPGINALVDVSLIDGSSHPSRVEDVDAEVYTVAAPFGIQDAERPDIGTLMEIVWLDDDSRLGAPARLNGFTGERPPRWQLRIVGEPRRQTRRTFVRGGGGEPVRLIRLDGDPKPVDGWVNDISEGGVRCRLLTGDFGRDDRLEVLIGLGDAQVTVSGRVLFVRYDPETEDFELVVTYETVETNGRTIRGYILRRQMEERRRMSGGC